MQDPLIAKIYIYDAKENTRLGLFASFFLFKKKCPDLCTRCDTFDADEWISTTERNFWSFDVYMWRYFIATSSAILLYV